MLKKTIKYTDYDGIEREEDFYFNLTKAEISLMELSEAGGLKNRMERIIQAKDTKSIIEVICSLIEKSYGVKSPDGRRFIKNPELFAEFEQTEAYSAFLMELLSDEKAAADFVQGILPNDLSAEVSKRLDEAKKPDGTIDIRKV